MSDVITHYILTQHYTNSLKCQCCDGRKAVLQSTYTLQVGETETHISSASSAETVTYSVMKIQLSLM